MHRAETDLRRVDYDAAIAQYREELRPRLIRSGPRIAKESTGGFMSSRDRERLCRYLGVVTLVAVATATSGCFESFVHKVREHQDCVGQAQIAQAKADFCMTDSNGHRRDFNACLSAQSVPDFKINRLDACVESAGHYGSY
ncbi:MAG: hypothetical protein ACREQC_00605 [Candidatus Binataceae bacterium]